MIYWEICNCACSTASVGNTKKKKGSYIICWHISSHMFQNRISLISQGSIVVGKRLIKLISRGWKNWLFQDRCGENRMEEICFKFFSSEILNSLDTSVNRLLVGRSRLLQLCEGGSSQLTRARGSYRARERLCESVFFFWMYHLMLYSINVYKLNKLISKRMHKWLINNYRLHTETHCARGGTPAVEDAPGPPGSAEWLKQHCELSAPRIDGRFLERKDNN